MKILGVIPARGGSKGVENKNIRLLAGRPLLQYTCEAAKASKKLSRVILSTDDKAIAAVGRDCGVEVPWMRPQELAQDDTPMLPVLQHAVMACQAGGFKADAVVLLQPTSPLRRAEHIDEAISLLEKTGADAVVSVTEVPHQFGPASLMQLKGEKLTPFQKGKTPSRRQDKPRLYARNGPAVLVARVPSLLKQQDLYGKSCCGYVMAPEDSVDLDGPLDFEYAEFLLARKGTHA